MQDNTPVSITYGGAKRIKTLLGFDDRRPKNQHHTNLSPSIYQSGFWATIEGETTARPATIDSSKPIGCYKWNRIETAIAPAPYTMTQESKGGNFIHTQRIVTEDGIFEGDYIPDVQDNFAVESLFASPYVIKNEAVFLRPSVYHNYYVFDYQPSTKLVLIKSTIDKATESGGTLTFKEGDVFPCRMNDTTATIDPAYKIKVRNPFRSIITATDAKPIYAEITYTQGWWYLSAVECK